MLPFLTIRDSPAPVIAAVNGICQAGGLLVAMMADIAVASDRATFRVPELLRGIPDATYAAALPAHVGVAVARDLLLSARRFDGCNVKRMLNQRYGDVDYQTMFWALDHSPEPREGMRAFMDKRDPSWIRPDDRGIT
jgi:enoyl-CoA hydratase